MSLADLDGARRMADYMKPEDLNTEGCLVLAETLLSDARDALVRAVKQYNDWPNKENHQHLRESQAFFRSDLFIALSCGVTDGETVIKQLTREALLGRKVKKRKEKEEFA